MLLDMRSGRGGKRLLGLEGVAGFHGVHGDGVGGLELSDSICV